MSDKSNTSTTIIHLTATTHFPIKLAAFNFPVWRKQVLSTLIGLDLHHFIDGTSKPPTKPSVEYSHWYRQDQILISALLGSCTDAIQPLLSSAETSHEAWSRLTTSYANASRSIIISLKSKLTTNPKGSRNVAEFVHDMRSIANEIALAQSPINDEDLMIHIIKQLGDDFKTIVPTIKVRKNPITYSKLYDKLVDFERLLKETEIPSTDVLTANYTHTSRNGSTQDNRSMNSSAFHLRSNYGSHSGSCNPRPQWPKPQNRNNRSNSHCQFCSIGVHDTKECCKLSRFLRENNIEINTGPLVNTTTTRTNLVQPPWLFDSRASHHVTSDRSNLQTPMDYGGPDKISLGDGTVAKLCKTNKVSVEFFPSYFIVKDLLTGAPLLRGVNDHDVYYAPASFFPQVNTVTTSTMHDWHHCLSHPSIKTFKSRVYFTKVYPTCHEKLLLALLHYADLPLRFWSHAFQTAAYLINRLPTAILDYKTPYEQLHQQPPNYTKLRPFGCLCSPWLKPYSPSKLHPKSSQCIFLGYSTSKSAYKCLDIVTKRLVIPVFINNQAKTSLKPLARSLNQSPSESFYPLPLLTIGPFVNLMSNNAFLQGTLHEDVYMIQPPGYKNKQLPNHICKLQKSLYGLKQAPRAWYMELKTFLLSYGFKKSQSDASLFIYSHKGILMNFLVYVDDIILTGNCTSFMNNFVDLLSKRFSIKDHDVTWVENLLQELHITVSKPPSLYFDNTDATYLCAYPVYHSRMKHVALDYHFVREKVAAGMLKVYHINSKDQSADALTKPLARRLFLKF
ncbi:hypothetical protein OSB04_029103 [Centaurea solstitialis]|uniref:Uncharacterized protein n=1 Tax=Centaurea solstitialis TaxID=347529 RepID=A0AA38W194_9ASTR|nr:hypothetical protein OSB04_029103 [Centaurea solstitialis]